MGSLMTHEIMINNHDKEEENDKKKKIIALKSSTQEEVEEDKEFNDSELDDIALLTKRYKKYLRFKKVNNLKKNPKGNFSRENKRKDDTIT